MEGMDPDEADENSFSIIPTKEKGIWQRGVGGQSVCTSVCVHVYPCLQADRQELWRSKACMPGCQLAG